MSALAIRNDREAIEYIIELIYDQARIHLHNGKESLIRARLGKRLRHYGFDSLAAYCNFLSQEAGREEITHAVDALTTNFTHFLREEDHFNFMVEQSLPELLGRARKPFRVWSAACATGEEPYSIAFYLAEHFPTAAGWDWSILATDISTRALERARQAIYAEDRLQKFPAGWLRQYFQRGQGAAEGFYRVKKHLRDRVAFRQMNLLDPYPFREQYEIILCRNVMIYFDRPTQEKLVHRLCEHLATQGFLFTGHSESLHGYAMPLSCRRPSIYQKD